MLWCMSCCPLVVVASCRRRDEECDGARISRAGHRPLRELDILQHVLGDRRYQPPGHGTGRRQTSRSSEGGCLLVLVLCIYFLGLRRRPSVRGVVARRELGRQEMPRVDRFRARERSSDAVIGRAAKYTGSTTDRASFDVPRLS